MRLEQLHGGASYWYLSTVKDRERYLDQTRQERDGAQVELKGVASDLRAWLGVRVGQRRYDCVMSTTMHHARDSKTGCSYGCQSRTVLQFAAVRVGRRFV